MKETRILMDMPITVEITDADAGEKDIAEVFSSFEYIDDTFSVFKKSSEISRINRGELRPAEYSQDVKEVLGLCEKTEEETGGYFNITTSAGLIDPSGLVKGWAISRAAGILKNKGRKNYYVEAGGDAETAGKYWRVGIKNPFRQDEIVKVVHIKDKGIATSGTYLRGKHIYNPRDKNRPADEIVSLTVIGPNAYEADRFATAAFAMGKKGIIFIENLPGFDGYMIDKNGLATMTSGFENYVKTDR